MTRTIEFQIVEGDITTFAADVVAVKYAQGFHGSDRAIANLLDQNGVSREGLRPEIGQTVVAETQRAIKAPLVIFVGTPYLRDFSYPQVREFTLLALEAVRTKARDARQLAMTIHGSNHGLDENESFLSQLRVCYESIHNGQVSAALERISIVERSVRRVQQLRQALRDELAKHEGDARSLPEGGYQITVGQTTGTIPIPKRVDAAAAAAEKKPYVFVAMPFSDEMFNVFNYGIQKPVHAAGCLCGRVDHEHFTGDIFQYIKERIGQADLVIADLTGKKPNVYLEVGYSWGLGKKTLLTIRRSNNLTEDLEFDVRGQRCLAYKSISELEGMIAKELVALKLDKGQTLTT